MTMIQLTFTKHPMVFASISWFTVARGHAQVCFTDLVLSARGVIAHDARVYSDRRGLGQTRATCRDVLDTWRGAGHTRHAGGGLPLGYRHVRLHVPVNVHGLHRERGADNLSSVLGGLGGLEHLLAPEILGGAHNGSLPGRGGILRPLRSLRPVGSVVGSLGRCDIEICPLSIYGHKLVPGSCLSDDI